MTGKLNSNNHTATSTNAHSDNYNTMAYTYTYGTSGTSTYTYDTHDNNSNVVWYPTPIGNDKWTTGGWITDETVIGGAELIWLPKKCMCCEKDIKVKNDSLSIKMGKTTFWFHRRCFSNKKNARFIRSLIISEDLELLD